jgi:hypothetical protein
MLPQLIRTFSTQILGHGGGFAGVPPFALCGRQFQGIERNHDRVALPFLANDLDAVGGAIPGRHIGNQLLPDPAPAWLFAMPLDPTTRPRQGTPIEQATARSHNPVSEVTARALDDVARCERVQRRITIDVKGRHDGAMIGGGAMDRKIHGD